MGFGAAHVVYPEADDERCTAALLVDVDPVGLVRDRRGRPSDFSLSQYVNDRPYAASSFLLVALAKVFATAMGGRSKERPDAGQEIPLVVRLPVLPCRGGEAVLRRLFEPLGYTVQAQAIPLDGRFPGWGDSAYLDVELVEQGAAADTPRAFVRPAARARRRQALLGRFDDEVDKLLRRGGSWLAGHPDRRADHPSIPASRPPADPLAMASSGG